MLQFIFRDGIVWDTEKMNKSKASDGFFLFLYPLKPILPIKKKNSLLGRKTEVIVERAFLENIKVGDQTLSAPIIDSIMNEYNRGIENATRAATGENNGPKTFTQEEVNRIVSERLERERAKGRPTPEDERETALKAREAAMDCRDLIEKNGYPKGFLDIFDTSDVDRFKEKIDKMIEVFPNIVDQSVPGPYAPGPGTQKIEFNDPIANAFKPSY